MDQLKFIIPQKPDDLLHPLEDPAIYYVNDVLTSLEIAQKLPETEQKLKADPLNILDEFGVIYSVLQNFGQLDSRLIERTWALTHKTSELFKDQLKEIFSVLNDSVGNLNLNESQNASRASFSQERGNLFESIQEKARFSNALKMLLFLNCSFVHLFEDALASLSHRQNFNESMIDGATPGPKRRKKQRTNSDDRDVSFKEYDRYKERVMRSMLQLLCMSLNKVAESQTEAREIAGHVLRVCYKLIENSPHNNLSKSRDLYDITFSLIGCGIEKYNQSLSFCLRFIQILQYREQLATLLADLVEHIVVQHDQRLLIGEILREIDRIDVKELSRDSSCPRAVSTFLIALSEKTPTEFIPSLNHMFNYLEQDSYIMRNASLSVMANLIINVLREEGQDKALRDELLDVLLAHIRDITGYSRSKVLSIWCSLSEKESIPLTHLVPVVSAAVGRLLDKSCLVRKNALRLIVTLLNNNPFAQRLPLKTFAEHHAKEKAILEQLIAEEKEKSTTEQEILDGRSQASQEEKDQGSQSTIEDNTEEETDLSMSSDSPKNPNPKEVNADMSVRNIALAEDSPVETQQRKVDFLEHAINFTKQIHKAIPLATEMLTSKNVTDIQEAVDFFVQCHEFGIDEALIGFKRMILLIHVQEKSVRETILSAYQRIFFESSRYDGNSNKDAFVVKNLINFVQEASIGECISLEILMSQFIDANYITEDMNKELWIRFTRKKPNVTIEEAIASIQLLGMISSTNLDVVGSNIEICVEYGLGSNGVSESDSRLIRETCIAIRKSQPRKIDDKRRMRMAKDNELFTRLSTILVESLTNLACEHWFSMCDEALRIIFDLAECPQIICQDIFGQMVDKLLKNTVQAHSIMTQDTNRNESPEMVMPPYSIQTTTQISQQFPTAEMVNALPLSRFIHFMGDVALDLAVFLELHVLLELKVRSAASQGGDSSAHNISAHNISISSRRRSRRYGAGNKSVDDQNLEEEIGLGGAEAEDVEMEFIESICDEDIVCGKSLLGKLSRVIVEVVADPIRYPQTELKLASSLALAKFMMVSAKYCHQYLRLLFTVIEKSKEPQIKINLLVAISDLCVRFPNQLDGWTSKIFDNLMSSDVSVRRACLKILSRLILCDILKAKDQISTIANLIVDEDEQISSFSRHFFLELSKKLNAIYNVLPDIISRLSDSKTGISADNFRIVMKFMFELIDKSAHIDRLVDKLCGRFMDTDDERHWSDLAFCLSLLKYSDKSIVKLFDKFDCYKDKLCIDSVRESISLTIANYRKTPHLKNEIKQMLDEFDVKIAKSVGEHQDEESMTKNDSITESNDLSRDI